MNISLIFLLDLKISVTHRPSLVWRSQQSLCKSLCILWKQSIILCVARGFYIHRVNLWCIHTCWFDEWSKSQWSILTPSIVCWFFAHMMELNVSFNENVKTVLKCFYNYLCKLNFCFFNLKNYKTYFLHQENFLKIMNIFKGVLVSKGSKSKFSQKYNKNSTFKFNKTQKIILDLQLFTFASIS